MGFFFLKNSVFLFSKFVTVLFYKVSFFYKASYYGKHINTRLMTQGASSYHT